MDKDVTVQEIRKSIQNRLSQLDELQQHIAAIKVVEAINALAGADSEGEPDQDD